MAGKWTPALWSKLVRGIGPLRGVVALSTMVLAVGAATPADAGTMIRTGDTNAGTMAIGFPHQRKLVRDASGYWYAVWMEQRGATSYYDILMSRSNDRNGTSWATPVELVGDGGIVAYCDTSSGIDCRYPAIDIDRTNGKIHLAFVMSGSWSVGTEFNDTFAYSKLTNLANWNVASAWKNVQESSSGYDIVSSLAWCGGDPTHAPSIAVDGSGNAHVGYIATDVVSGTEDYPYYRYGSLASGWATPVRLSTTNVYDNPTYGFEFRYPTVEVDSTNKVHYAWVEWDGTYWDSVKHRSATTPFAAFAAAVERIGIANHNLFYLSMAADNEGKVYILAEDDSEADIAGTYWDGASWTENENIDVLGWDRPQVAVRLDTGATTDLILSPDTNADPDPLWYWKGGSTFVGAEVDTLEVTDEAAASIEKRAPDLSPFYGFLYYDWIGGSSSDISFGRIYLYDVVLDEHTSGQLADQFGAADSYNDATLYNFQLKNTSAATINVSQIVFQISGVMGMDTADLSDLRIKVGGSDVWTGGTPSISGATGTITFSGTLTIPANSTVDYTLTGDAVTPVGGDRLTISLGTANVTLASGTLGGYSVTAATHSRDYASTFQVAGSADDSYADSANDNATYLNYHLNTSAQITRYSEGSSTKRNAGIRFPSVTIPQNSIINRAEVSFYLLPTDSDDIYCTVYGHDNSSSPDFATNTKINDQTAGTGRPRTAGVAWQQTDIGAGWKNKDVTSVIQALVNRGDWDAGSRAATLLFISDATTPSQSLVFRTFDYSSGNYRPKLYVDYTLPYDIVLGNHGTGQVLDQLDGQPTRDDVPLFRFRLRNTGVARTVNQLVVRLTGVSGISDGELTDVKLNDGGGQVATGTASISGGTLTINSGFVVGAGATVDYTVTGDLSQLVLGDALTLSLTASDITLATGTTGGSNPLPVTHTADATALLGEHGSGQFPDALDGRSPHNDANLFRFQLQNTIASSVTVNSVVFLLSSVTGIADGDFSDLRLFDGTANVGGVPSVSVGGGTLAFSVPFSLAVGTTSFTLTGDLANLVNGDTLTLALGTANVTLTAGSMGPAGTLPSSRTHTADHAVTLASHSGGQSLDSLNANATQNNVPLFKFRLTNNTGATATVSQLAFQLSGVFGLNSGDFSGLRVNYSGGDVTTTTNVSIAGGTGSITFGNSFTIGAGEAWDYTLYGNLSFLYVGDTLTVALGSANMTLAGGSVTGSVASPAMHTVDPPTLTFQVSAPNDDSYADDLNDNATTYLTAAYVDSYRWSAATTTKKNGGLRFPNVGIPQGATIGSATLSLYVYDTNYDNPYLTVYGHAVDNAPDFAANRYIATAAQRPRTSQSHVWQQTGAPVGWNDRNVTRDRPGAVEPAGLGRQ